MTIAQIHSAVIGNCKVLDDSLLIVKSDKMFHGFSNPQWLHFEVTKKLDTAELR